MVTPQVIGEKEAREGVTIDLVLTDPGAAHGWWRVRGVLRSRLGEMSLADHHRQHTPEYGATCGFFPVDAETLRYLRRMDQAEVDLVELTGAGAVPHTAPTPSS